MKAKDKFKGFGAKLYSGFLWVIQIIIMGIIGYGSLMFVGVFAVQKLIIELVKATDFGKGAVPQTIDLALMVGFPALFIMGVMFVGLLLFYKKLWGYFTKTFNKMRDKFILKEEQK